MKRSFENWSFFIFLILLCSACSCSVGNDVSVKDDNQLAVVAPAFTHYEWRDPSSGIIVRASFTNEPSPVTATLHNESDKPYRFREFWQTQETNGTEHTVSVQTIDANSVVVLTEMCNKGIAVCRFDISQLDGVQIGYIYGSYDSSFVVQR